MTKQKQQKKTTKRQSLQNTTQHRKVWAIRTLPKFGVISGVSEEYSDTVPHCGMCKFIYGRKKECSGREENNIVNQY